jgi:hypothetical protein
MHMLNNVEVRKEEFTDTPSLKCPQVEWMLTKLKINLA